MKTKTLVLTGLLSFAASASLMAQVYSQNIVGYANVSVPPGFSMIANPLKAGTNTVGALFSGGTIAEGTTIFKFGPSGYSVNQYYGPEDGWSNPDETFAPGEGAFIRNYGANPFTVTFVGEVVLANTNALPTGFSIKGSAVPIQQGLSHASINFPAAEGDIVYKFVNNQYETYQYYGPEDGWSVEPQNVVGQAFWVYKQAPASWVQSFSVNSQP